MSSTDPVDKSLDILRLTDSNGRFNRAGEKCASSEQILTSFGQMAFVDIAERGMRDSRVLDVSILAIF